MKFGINLLSQHRADRQQSEMYAEMLEQASAADELGFDSLFLNEHHPFDRTDDLWLQPLPALAGLATRTRRIALGTNILILPLYHPLRVAEDIGMIHAMSSGRAILGIGIGYKPEEFEAFGLSLKQRVSRFEEQIEIIRRLWSEAGVTFHGRHFTFSNVSLPLATFPSPMPPIWIGAEVAPAIRRAAKLGDAWLPADTASISLLQADYATYSEALAHAGKPFDDKERPLMRETLVAADSQQARESLAPYVVQKYREYWQMGAPQLRAEFSDDRFDFETLSRDRFITGSPEECIEQIERHQTELGITHMIFRIQKTGMPHQQVLKVMRMLAEKVIPFFR